MSGCDIYLKGLDELEKNVNQMVKDVTSAKTELLLKQAQLVRDRIKEKAPLGPSTDKKPGSLKAAAYAVALPETTTRPAMAFAGIRPRKAPHAHLVEFGHGGPHPAPPHPFIRPAWDELSGTVKSNLAAGLGRVIEASTT